MTHAIDKVASDPVSPDAVEATSGRPSFCLAHLSDLHLASPLALAAGDVFNKRLVGYLSWKLRRRHIHRSDVLRVLTADLLAAGPDHIAVTGDIVNISLAAEFRAAADWLATLGPSHRVSVVPGNHDAYVPVSWERSCSAWRVYMTSDGAPDEGRASPGENGPFPFIRRRGPIALVGLSSAIPSAPGFALGRVGEAQLAEVGQQLRRLGEAGAFRILLIHHPPVAGRGQRRQRLIDADAFAMMLARAGGEMVLHGHNHFARFYDLPGRDGPVPVVGVASASALPVDGHPPGQYHLYRIARTTGGWDVEVEVRGVDGALRVSEADRRRLTIARRHVDPAISGG
jgi:3',5'-cyclic AMP phosphodiesterase CpdA